MTRARSASPEPARISWWPAKIAARTGYSDNWDDDQPRRWPGVKARAARRLLQFTVGGTRLGSGQLVLAQVWVGWRNGVHRRRKESLSTQHSALRDSLRAR